ncbi:MAG: helix-turn-helix domain-containing protein [Bacteroidaceae bacterium]|nr:helix-turn-helix domain-containing protein [Bacteroidaceae bacterium]
MAKYNITEKKEKDASYRMHLRPELVDELYEQILSKFIVEKKYRDPDYSARQLAIDLNTNTRYISAVINLRFQQNYSCLVNDYRIREALYMLIDNRYLDKSIEDIALAVGFANRQSFYAAFYRMKGITPKEYRRQQLEKLQKK